MSMFLKFLTILVVGQALISCTAVPPPERSQYENFRYYESLAGPSLSNRPPGGRESHRIP